MPAVSESPEVRGVEIDSQTRCVHYCKPVDVIAIKMRCCGVYYSCKYCHDELAGHRVEVWPQREWSEKAVLCGCCRTELSINDYMASDAECPVCQAQWNRGCRHHYHFYFEMQRTDISEVGEHPR